MTATLVLLRHGESEWNLKGLFTGWYDAELTDAGIEQATQAGRDLLAAGILPQIVHTSVQTRAIRTVNLALDEMERLWLPVRRSWRLNERHYGDLTGKDKKATADEFGSEQVKVWRRSYDTPPPPITSENPYDVRTDPRYADLSADEMPLAECLKDVVDRMLPYWFSDIVPDLQTRRTVLVGAHGNSLRALVKYLDDISDHDITELNLPTGVPIVYEIGDDAMPTERRHVTERFVGDVEAAKAAAEAVARQAG